METKMDGTEKEQEKAIRYYDKISNIYDYISKGTRVASLCNYSIFYKVTEEE